MGYVGSNPTRRTKTMIKVILFDIGGVVKKMDYNKICNDFEFQIGASTNSVFVYTKINFKKLIKGKISLNQFWKDMKKLSTKNVSLQKAWIEATEKNTTVDYRLISLIKDLRKNYVVGVLSNVSYSRLFTDRKINLYKDFDFTIFSCKEGLQKPNKNFYLLAIKRIKVKPKEILFIDDNTDNIKSARDTGLNAVLYKYKQINKLKKEFKKFNINV